MYIKIYWILILEYKIIYKKYPNKVIIWENGKWLFDGNLNIFVMLLKI